MKYSTKLNKGYTLLFAVLIATLVLGVSVFILSVSTKQYQLAVAARESMFAFYAADSAYECALQSITDRRITIESVDPIPEAKIMCNGNLAMGGTFIRKDNVTYYQDLGFVGNDVWVSEKLRLKLSNSTCAEVIVIKGSTRNINSTPGPQLMFDIRGYNLCDEDGTRVPSTRTIERGLNLIIS
ncbi:MAG: hypothetical protein M3Q80_02160 [bacterium]|nr:hypothetical protein [bacterium]